jgi:predicted nucleic acid-binding protein
LNRFVVDASIAIKWYLPENYNEEAAQLLDPRNELFAPDLLLSEIGNILWKRVIKGECSANKAFTIMRELQSHFLQIWGVGILAGDAFDIACRTKRTFYDSLYVALAVKKDCLMVTADLKLYNAIKKTSYKEYMLWVEDISL